VVCHSAIQNFSTKDECLIENSSLETPLRQNLQDASLSVYGGRLLTSGVEKCQVNGASGNVTPCKGYRTAVERYPYRPNGRKFQANFIDPEPDWNP